MRNAAWCAAPLLLAALCLITVRWGIGFQFPVPWPDETSFISPAFDFATRFTLFDPGLNPDRVVMWMPPGYMLFLAAFFRLFGYGFALARWLSAACVLASLALAARIVWQHTMGRNRLLAAWTVGLAFASPYTLIGGNMARMEALFCALMLAALSLGLAGRLYAMAALTAAAALVHFNAIYFVPAVAVAFAGRWWHGQLTWPGRGGRIALALSTICLGAYGVLVAMNWPGFLADMGVQFGSKFHAGLNDPAHPAWMLWAAASLIAAHLALVRRGSESLLLALFGAGFVVMAHYGRELWYDYGQPLGFALIALAFLMQRSASARRCGRSWMIPAAAAIVLVGVTGLRITPFLRPLLPRPAMLTHAFLPRAEIARIRHFIATRQPGETVMFGWTGVENYFLADLARAHAHWVLMQHSATQNLPFRAADWNIDCDSSPLFPKLPMYSFDLPPHGDAAACRIIAVSVRARQQGDQ